MQKKYIQKHLAERDRIFWQRAERFVKGFVSYLDAEGMTLHDAVDAYVRVCKDMLVEQIRFARTSSYRYQSAHEVDQSVYSNPKTMSYHMQGLSISHLLWPNHYLMYDFFCREIVKAQDSVQTYLEIGAGHGLFLAEAMDAFKRASFVVVDISQTSIRMARKMIHHLSQHSADVRFHCQDIMNFDENATFDFITMGEVLEHVEDPRSLLDKVCRLLTPKGRAYVTTCCNCPAIDHVYLFRGVKEIRQLIEESGLRIQREIALPVGEQTNGPAGPGHVEINYAAVVRRAEI
ncbi:MAG: class I SAM-dependent methyltransferase [Thermodesulfobacteriota bacterium]|nr:class I SAM-dependent methyltransferase [Thermodesulfobacteriota bacterium]